MADYSERTDSTSVSMLILPIMLLLLLFILAVVCVRVVCVVFFARVVDIYSGDTVGLETFGRGKKGGLSRVSWDQHVLKVLLSWYDRKT